MILAEKSVESLTSKPGVSAKSAPYPQPTPPEQPEAVASNSQPEIEVVCGVDRTGKALTRWMPRQRGTGYD